jgi:hypothetical protein
MIATELLPDRYLLTPERLAAAMDMASIKPSPRSGFGALPSVKEPAAILRGTKLVTPKGALSAEAEWTVRVASDPHRVLTVLALFAGDPNLRHVSFLQGQSENPVVIQRRDERGWDLTLLPTIAQAIVMVDDLLSLTRLPSQLGGKAVELDLPAYVAILAAADAIQTARLAARVSRSRVPAPTLTANLLAEQLEKGLASRDTRWAVTAARLTAPVDLGIAKGQMARGIEKLQSLGFVKPVPNGYGLTKAGLNVAGPLGHLLNASGLVLVMADAAGGNQTTVATMNLFRTMASIWLAMWTNVRDDNAKLRVMEVSAAGALRLMRGMLEQEAGEATR